MDTLVKYDDVVRQMRKLDGFAELPGLCSVVRISGEKDMNSISENRPVQCDGLSVMLVMSGSIDIELNMEHYEVNGPALMVILPRTLVRLKSGTTGKFDVLILLMSSTFLQEININYAALSTPMPFEKPSPVRPLQQYQANLLVQYFELLAEVSRSQANLRLDTNIASSLVSAMIYQVAQFYYKQLADNSPRAESYGNRPSNYVNEFLRLLQLHYMKERSVTFYADKLFISPKYLSLLVKKATGRSASRWIDDRVIMEARNLLRYSGKNIQQVAYMLNFSNQSSFGKYFKHLTGMSPTDYQKS